MTARRSSIIAASALTAASSGWLSGDLGAQLVARPTRENVSRSLISTCMPLGPVDREVDVLPAALVELVAVPLLQQLAERGHLAQRLLQVVRGHVGELLELGVGPAQLGGLRVQVGGLAGGNSCAAWRPRRGDQPAAHRLDVGGDRAQVGRAGDGDPVAVVTGRHPAGRARSRFSGRRTVWFRTTASAPAATRKRAAG